MKKKLLAFALSVAMSVSLVTPAQAAAFTDDSVETVEQTTVEDIAEEELADEAIIDEENVDMPEENVEEEDKVNEETIPEEEISKEEISEEEIDTLEVLDNEEETDEVEQEEVFDGTLPEIEGVEWIEDGDQYYAVMTNDHILQAGGFGTAYYATDEYDALSGLPQWQRDFKDRILNAYRANLTEISIRDFNLPITETNWNIVKDLWGSVINENPDLFYADHNAYMHMEYGYFSKISLFYLPEYTNIDATGRVTVKSGLKEAYQFAVQQAMSVTSGNMSDLEKVLALYDYLMLHCEYDWDFPDTCYSAFAALVTNKAVCQGYALALADLCRRVGIECYVVTSEDMWHAWNLVKLDGKWYHMDATWDDPDIRTSTDAPGHQFFLKSDSEFLDLGHYNWDMYYAEVGTPRASTSNSYSNYIFRSNDVGTTFWYSNGKWYYLNGRVITESNVKGGSLVSHSDMGKFDDLQLEDGRFYFSNKDGVYTAGSISKDKVEKFWIPVYHPGYHVYSVKDMYVNHNIVTLNVYDNAKKTSTKLNYYNTQRDKTAPQLRVLSGVDFKNYKSYTTSIPLSNLKLQLVYGNGTKVTLDKKEHGITSISGNFKSKKYYEHEFTYKGLKSNKIKFTVDPNWKFTDVYSDSNNWQYKAVSYVSGKGYMNGKTSDVFGADQTLTRAEMVVTLYSIAGKPKVSYKSTFSDVAKGKWYTNAIMWAYNKKIISGNPDGTFGVDDNITREQLALMLYNFAKVQGKSVKGSSSVSKYKDSKKIDSWAKTAIQWSVYSGIMSGKSSETLDPLGSATRAEAATMIIKYNSLKK